MRVTLRLPDDIAQLAKSKVGHNGFTSLNQVYVAAITEFVQKGRVYQPVPYIQSADLTTDPRISPDWQPDDNRVSFALLRAGINGYTQEQVQAFISHYRAKPPNRQVDWDEMFINWCIKAKGFSGGSNEKGGRTDKFDAGEEILSRVKDQFD